MTQKLLITGSSGFLGWNLINYAIPRWSVHGLYNKTRNEQAGATYHTCDISDCSALRKVFSSVRPDAVVHLAAASSPNECQLNPTQTRRINVEASAHLASLCSRAQIPLVFTSSSQVYAGTEPPYSETSRTEPVNDYGKQKLDAESVIQQNYPDASICRVPLMFGAAPPSTTSSLQLILNALTSGQSLSLFTDEWRSVLGARSASIGLCHMLDHPGEVFILAGNETLSRYEFGLRVAAFFKLEASLIRPVSQKDVTLAAARPSDLTMMNLKAKQAGFAPLSIHDEFMHARRLMASCEY